MRKKLLLIAFTFVTFLFVGIVNVNADTEIGDVVLDGTSIVPVVGGTLQTLTVPVDAPYEIAAQVWEKFPPNNPVTTFENGKEYSYVLALRPKSGYSFAEGNKIIIEGVSWSFVGSGVIDDAEDPYDGCLVLEALYTKLNLSSNSVVLDGSSIVPVAGGTPQLLTIPSDAPYEVTIQGWADYIEGDSVTTFEPEKEYIYLLVLKPKSGHSFNEEDMLIMEGISWRYLEGGVVNDSDSEYYGKLAISGLYRVPAESPNPEDGNPTTPIEDNENPTIPEVDDENQNEDGAPIEEEIPEEETPQNGDTINDTENPQTGDNIALSIVLGLISLVGLTGVAVYTKKRIN